jgi:hypothetical protein
LNQQTKPLTKKSPVTDDIDELYQTYEEELTLVFAKLFQKLKGKIS